MHNYTYDCAVKENVRVLALNHKRGKPAKCFLCLPGRECLDIQSALKHGFIDKNTKIVFVERCAYDYHKIIEKLASLGFTNIVGHRADLRYDCINLRILPHSIDLAFIDICGEYTDGIYNWIKENKWKFTKDIFASLTTMANSRYAGREHNIRWIGQKGMRTSPIYTESLIPIRIKKGVYPHYNTTNYTADCWATMFHHQLCGKPTKNNNHFVQQILYRSPDNKKQNMAVITIQGRNGIS